MFSDGCGLRREAQGRSVGCLCQVRSLRARAEISANGVRQGRRHRHTANTRGKLFLQPGHDDWVSRLITRIRVVRASNVRRAGTTESKCDAPLIDIATSKGT